MPPDMLVDEADGFVPPPGATPVGQTGAEIMLPCGTEDIHSTGAKSLSWKGMEA